MKQKLNYIKKHWAGNLNRYQAQEQLLNGRNSYSKTDTGATFMRMKEDHMRNGQLKPAYNLQLSTHNQYILCYSVHQNPTDTLTLESHLHTFKQIHGLLPEVLTADAGYGSQQNYTLLEQNNIEAFVKYNHFDKEQHTANPNPFHTDHLHYNASQNCYYCPMGQPMTRISDKLTKTAGGFMQSYARYQAQNCQGCPLRGQCHKGQGNRIIEVNNQLLELKQKARQRLQSERGVYHRKKRPADVEPVFANLKHNKQFKRFMLRGMEKVSIETALLAMAHNLKKKAA